MPENKVIYGLKNAHYALITEGVDGVHTYAAPVPLEGAVEISLEPKGEQSDFYADDRLFHTTVSNQGYETTLTIANFSREFRTDVLGEVLEGTDNVLTETTAARPKNIAFLFEFDGDQKAVRHVLYNCTVARPSLTSATKTETAEPSTQELTLVAAPRPSDGVVKRSTLSDTPDTIYDVWYTAVYAPTAPPEGV
jgi:phi13 family phage major tail protein